MAIKNKLGYINGIRLIEILALLKGLFKITINNWFSDHYEKLLFN